MFTDRKSISEILNTQFRSVFTKKTSSKIPELPGVTFPSIKDLKITEFGVFKLLDKIDVSKASGPDCIPGRILQNLARELALVLHFIFEQSLNTGDLPAEWTLAIMRMSRKQTPISTQYELSGQVLEEELKDAKYLDVTVSDDLEWTKHINAVAILEFRCNIAMVYFEEHSIKKLLIEHYNL